MPKSALPEHLQDVENNFPDDEQFGTKTLFGKLYRWYQKATKTTFAFSYRCTEWWAKWRKIPKVLIAVKGKGQWRFEQHNSPDDVGGENWTFFGSYLPVFREFYGGDTEWYLSRIQYYTRWHFAIQWPLMISFHFYFKASDVPVPGQTRPDSDGKLFYFYWNHYDADMIYWMITSIFIGFVWK